MCCESDGCFGIIAWVRGERQRESLLQAGAGSGTDMIDCWNDYSSNVISSLFGASGLCLFALHKVRHRKWLDYLTPRASLIDNVSRRPSFLTREEWKGACVGAEILSIATTAKWNSLRYSRSPLFGDSSLQDLDPDYSTLQSWVIEQHSSMVSIVSSLSCTAATEIGHRTQEP